MIFRIIDGLRAMNSLAGDLRAPLLPGRRLANEVNDVNSVDVYYLERRTEIMMGAFHQPSVRMRCSLRPLFDDFHPAFVDAGLGQAAQSQFCRTRTRIEVNLRPTEGYRLRNSSRHIGPA
jgi:hypothetical protein